MDLAQIFAYPEIAEFFGMKKSELPLAPPDAITQLADRGLPKIEGRGYKVREVINRLSEQTSIDDLSYNKFDLISAAQAIIDAAKNDKNAENDEK